MTIASTISYNHLSNISFNDYFKGEKAGLKKVKPNFKHVLAKNNQLFENHALPFCFNLSYTKLFILKIFTPLLI